MKAKEKGKGNKRKITHGKDNELDSNMMVSNFQFSAQTLMQKCSFARHIGTSVHGLHACVLLSLVPAFLMAWCGSNRVCCINNCITLYSTKHVDYINS